MNVAMPIRRARSLAPQALLVLVLAALLAACGASAKAQTAQGSGGGASSVGAAGDSIDACALVTRTEAAALLGVPVGEAHPKTVPGGVTTCSYLSSAPRDLRQVFVWANPRQTADGARKVFDNTKKGAAEGVAPREQAGLGDDAFWADNQLWVRKGKVVLAFSADSEANTQQLAAQVLSRLP